jgi:hypothetical protein
VGDNPAGAEARVNNFSGVGLEDRVMAKAEISTTIKRPVEDVFAMISNIENNPKWSSGVLEAKITSVGPIGMGTTGHVVGKFLGKRIESDSEITGFEPNRTDLGQRPPRSSSSWVGGSRSRMKLLSGSRTDSTPLELECRFPAACM